MNIAIVEDHLILSQSLQHAVEASIPGSHVRVFDNGLLFLACNFAQWRPDVVISDILMPGLGGLEMVEKAIPLLGEQCKFILMSSVTDANMVKNAMRKGVKGYVAKGASLQELMDAIAAVREGKQYISQSLKDDLLTFIFTDEPMVSDLSPRENEVLQRICSGRTPKEIAYDMKLSIHTVQLYNKSILRKFKLNRTADLRVYAMEKGLYKGNV